MRSILGRRGLAVASVVVGCAVAVIGCRSHASQVSNDPAQPIFRSATADLSAIHGVALHFTSVTTNTNEGVDLLKEVFLDSLKADLGPKFGDVKEGDAAPAGGAVLDISLRVNWGSRAARAMVGFGAGKAGIDIQYDMKDEHGTPIARLHHTDSMSGGFYGGDSKALIYNAADKWNKYFVGTVLAAPPPAAK